VSAVSGPSGSASSDLGSQSTFRTDIAGIRGIAVMLVVLCHFEIPGFGGGFIGPDIFFVLSGYLITGLLVKEYGKNISDFTGRGSISVGAFYLRRARRILPASLFVLLCTDIYAWRTLNFLQWAQVKSDSIWTVFFGANINFLRQATDYFAQSNAVSPLQHYWSLSVEEQFYFVWPVLFLMAASFHEFRFRGREINRTARLRAFFMAMGIGSFVWMLFEFTTSPTTAYFSTFSRAWELALGGVLSLVSVEGLAAKLGRNWTILRGSAAVAIVGAIAFVSPSNFGYTLFIPAVATGFLLVSGAHAKGDPIYRVLSARPLTALGTISFSVYLWHWPVVVFGRDLGLMNTLGQRLVGVGLCIFMGTISYWLIERTCLRIPLPKVRPGLEIPGRVGLGGSRVFTSLVTALVVAALSWVTYSSSSAAEASPSPNWVPPTSAAIYAPKVDPSKVGSDGNTVGKVGAESSTSLTPAGKAWAQKVRAGLKLQSVSPTLGDALSKQTQVGLADTDLPYVCQDLSKIFPAQGQYASYDCSFGPPVSSAAHKLLIVGDSDAWTIRNAILSQFDLQKVSLNVRVINSASCPFAAVQGSSVVALCTKNRQRTYAEVKKYRPDYLLIADHANVSSGFKGSYGSGLLDSVRAVRKKTGHIAIIGSQPERSLRSENCLDNKFKVVDACFFSATSGQNFRLAQQQVATLTGQAYIDPVSWLCAGAKCPPIIDDTMVFSDNHHYSSSFVKKIAPLIVEQLNKFGFGSSLGLR